VCLGVSGERVSVCGGFGTIWVCLAVCVCYDGYSAASGVSMGSLAMWVARLATSGVKFRCEGRGLGGGWRAGSTLFPLPAPISISTICLSKPIHFSVCFTLTFLFFFLFIFFFPKWDVFSVHLSSHDSCNDMVALLWYCSGPV
jgi:hypothetical protein